MTLKKMLNTFGNKDSQYNEKNSKNSPRGLSTSFLSTDDYDLPPLSPQSSESRTPTLFQRQELQLMSDLNNMDHLDLLSTQKSNSNVNNNFNNSNNSSNSNNVVSRPPSLTPSPLPPAEGDSLGKHDDSDDEGGPVDLPTDEDDFRESPECGGGGDDDDDDAYSTMIADRYVETETERYTYIKALNSGAFGEVYLVHDEKMDMAVALKVISLQNTNKEDALKEMGICMRLNHPYIIHTYDWFSTLEESFIVQEYCGGGDLFGVISPLNGIGDEKRIKRYTFQVLSAVSYLHSLNIVHKDLKPENVMLTDNDEVRLIDFGLSGSANDPVDPLVGTLPYMAPEVYRRSNHTSGKAADVWALGVMLYTMLVGDLPWDYPSHHDPGYKNYTNNGCTFEFNFSDALHSMLRHMFEFSVFQRYLVDDLFPFLKSPWFLDGHEGWNSTQGSRALLPNLQSGSQKQTFGVHHSPYDDDLLATIDQRTAELAAKTSWADDSDIVFAVDDLNEAEINTSASSYGNDSNGGLQNFQEKQMQQLHSMSSSLSSSTSSLPRERKSFDGVTINFLQSDKNNIKSKTSQEKATTTVATAATTTKTTKTKTKARKKHAVATGASKSRQRKEKDKRKKTQHSEEKEKAQKKRRKKRKPSAATATANAVPKKTSNDMSNINFAVFDPLKQLLNASGPNLRQSFGSGLDLVFDPHYVAEDDIDENTVVTTSTNITKKGKKKKKRKNNTNSSTSSSTSSSSANISINDSNNKNNAPTKDSFYNGFLFDDGICNPKDVDENHHNPNNEQLRNFYAREIYHRHQHLTNDIVSAQVTISGTSNDSFKPGNGDITNDANAINNNNNGNKNNRQNASNLTYRQKIQSTMSTPVRVGHLQIPRINENPFAKFKKNQKGVDGSDGLDDNGNPDNIPPNTPRWSFFENHHEFMEKNFSETQLTLKDIHKQLVTPVKINSSQSNNIYNQSHRSPNVFFDDTELHNDDHHNNKNKHSVSNNCRNMETGNDKDYALQNLSPVRKCSIDGLSWGDVQDHSHTMKKRLGLEEENSVQSNLFHDTPVSNSYANANSYINNVNDHHNRIGDNDTVRRRLSSWHSSSEELSFGNSPSQRSRQSSGGWDGDPMFSFQDFDSKSARGSSSSSIDQTQQQLTAKKLAEEITKAKWLADIREKSDNEDSSDSDDDSDDDSDYSGESESDSDSGSDSDIGGTSNIDSNNHNSPRNKFFQTTEQPLSLYKTDSTFSTGGRAWGDVSLDCYEETNRQARLDDDDDDDGVPNNIERRESNFSLGGKDWADVSQTTIERRDSDISIGGRAWGDIPAPVERRVSTFSLGGKSWGDIPSTTIERRESNFSIGDTDWGDIPANIERRESNFSIGGKDWADVEEDKPDRKLSDIMESKSSYGSYVNPGPGKKPREKEEKILEEREIQRSAWGDDIFINDTLETTLNDVRIDTNKRIKQKTRITHDEDEDEDGDSDADKRRLSSFSVDGKAWGDVSSDELGASNAIKHLDSTYSTHGEDWGDLSVDFACDDNDK